MMLCSCVAVQLCYKMQYHLPARSPRERAPSASVRAGERAGRTNIQLPLRGTSVRGARGGGRGREEEGEEEEEEEEERSWKRWSNGVDRMTMW